jgi:hypothetical protein
MIPSPVNLSTVPSNRSTPAERSAKKRSMIERQASGSFFSARSIEPRTSANRTVTCLRSPSGAASSARPHWLQNRAPSLLSWPQPAQITAWR